MSTRLRSIDDDPESPRPSKRFKVEDPGERNDGHSFEHILPPSHTLLGLSAPIFSPDEQPRIREEDVGISEYISKDEPQIEGIIKQRFTDFLVYEIDQEGHVVHLKNITSPEETINSTSSDTRTFTTDKNQENGLETLNRSDAQAPPSQPTPANNEKGQLLWTDKCVELLAPLLSLDLLHKLEQMVSEGSNGSPAKDRDVQRQQTSSKELTEQILTLPSSTNGGAFATDGLSSINEEAALSKVAKVGKQPNSLSTKQGSDHRKLITDPMLSKEQRTALHKAVRELFHGKLDTETLSNNTTKPDQGSRIVIKWAQHDSGRRSDRAPRQPRDWPPFIHFTMQKTNRDTHDALAYLSRTLNVNPKDLAVAGTKDKRGVTTQRVSLKRHNKTLEDVWKMANGFGRLKTTEQIIGERADRGTRIGDLVYRRAGLELGMLKGNAFVITLRNVRTTSTETLDRVMESMKSNGFINYYGMQRFGTASIPTHSIGLALLQSDWTRAVSLILRPRPGEHPEAEAARRAWLEERDIDKALRLMPRRIVAERCLLESYKKQKGDDRNAMGALSTIPRNLRLMYVHAYQSYVWNAIVSERIKHFGYERPVEGDLVFDNGDTEDAENQLEVANETEGPAEVALQLEGAILAIDKRADSAKRKKAWQAPRVKILTQDDLSHYSIFDVIMPLPGKDVAYPGGILGDMYRNFLQLDGLDPDNFVRKQKDYTLCGSYRKILHQPKDLTWKVLRYTDPDIALAQADEDILLGFNGPSDEVDGKFVALQIKLSLGTAAYATMALRELLKTDTGSQFQSSLTRDSEDQQFRGITTDSSATAMNPDEVMAV